MIYKLIKWTWIILSASLLACNSKEETQFYENGSIKSTIELKEGKRHGTMYSYYSGGALKSKGTWKNGLQDGLTIFYYLNGNVKERTLWKDDKANGLSEEYYLNGQLKKKAYYKNDKIIGEITIYDQNGKALETRIYNQNGDMIYAKSFDKGGHGFGWPIPLFKDEKDTVSVGETFKTTVSFGYKLQGEVKMLVGPIDKMNILIDTLSIIEPTERGEFIYSTVATTPGQNSVSLKFVHKKYEGDTLSVNDLSIKHLFFVKEPKNI